MKTITYHRLLIMLTMFALITFNTQAQFAFTNSNNLLSTASHSGCAVTVVDVNNDGLDDIVKMDQSTTLVIDMQNRNGSFTHYSLGTISGSRVWGMAVADVDHNGWKDVATGSNGEMFLVKLSWTGSTIAANTTQLAQSYFVQNITFGDFNNDGWADLSVCDDNNYDKIYVNNSGVLSPTTTLINTNINAGSNYTSCGGNDPYDSGNYGSVWTDFDNDGDLDLYIAHCRQCTGSSTDQRRRDRLFVNDGNNNYTEQGQSYGIEVSDFKQTWTTSFGDLDNDGDLDIVMTNHGENGQILQNDGTGHFTDITASTGFTTPGSDPIESFVEDFDNDGYLDILVSGGGGGDSYFLYHNNGNSTFTLATSPFASTGNGMLSFGAGDLNHDGKMDVFASYGNVYNTPTSTDDVLWLNSTNNTNHFITFALTGTVSNLGAIGARVTIYGAWGKQIREVRAGESYGTSNTMQCHFGLGANTVIDSARIDWPSHLQTHFTNIGADQFVTAVEGTCSIANNIIPGPYFFCTGQTLTLTTASGFTSYNWSNGDMTQSTTISATGIYNVIVTSADGCTSISPSVSVQLNGDQTPTIAAVGDLEFCDGSSVQITAPAGAQSYLWSNGETTQNITVTQSGTYNLTIQGDCASFTSANSISVVVHTPVLPVSSDVTIPAPGSATLNATGNNISWYDVSTGGTALATGNTFNTPVVNTTTVFYVESAETFGGGIQSVGLTTSPGTYSPTNYNAQIYFDVLQNCTLQTVTVFTDLAGVRVIELRDNVGTLVDSRTINIATGTQVLTLNFVLTPGTQYSLGTDATTNQGNFGYIAPHLERSGNGVVYPYTFNNVLSITGNSVNNGYFYYFYDWQVEKELTVCPSVRVPVTVFVTPNNINEITKAGIRVYPNPANNKLFIQLDNATATKVSVFDQTGRLLKDELFNATSNTLDIAHLAAGVYQLQIQKDNNQFMYKLVVQ